MMLAKASTILVSIGAAGGLLGWQLQARASDALELAHELQTREFASDPGTPSTDDNEEIIGVLSDSIDLRRSIEEILVQIENDVGFLAGQQERALTVTRQAREELAVIGASLAGSVTASRGSVRGLRELQEGLRRSASLAWSIAEELEELDRKMGPGAGGRP